MQKNLFGWYLNGIDSTASVSFTERNHSKSVKRSRESQCLHVFVNGNANAFCVKVT